MKKKLVQLIIVGMMATLLGCQANAEESGTSSEEEAREVIELEDMEEDASNEETLGEGDSEAEQENDGEPELSRESDYLDVTFAYEGDSYYTDTLLTMYHFNTIVLENSDYPELSQAVEQWNEAYRSETMAYLEEMQTMAEEEYEAYGPDSFIGPYTLEADMFLRRADSTALSVVLSVYSYAGGAHGMTAFDCVNLDSLTGEEITLDAVVTDVSRLPEFIADEMLAAYPHITYLTETLEDTIQEYVTPTDPAYAPEFVWTLGYDGITFYFGSYAIGSYADGVQQVTLTYSEYPELFRPEYFETAAENYAVDVVGYYSDPDLNRDRVADYIQVVSRYDAEYGLGESYEVRVNDAVFSQYSYYYELDVHLAEHAGKNYLLVERTMENAYQVVDIYEITPDAVTFVADAEGGLECFTNTDEFTMLRRADLLSTYQVLADCQMQEDGTVSTLNPRHEITWDITLVTICDLPAELVDEEGNLLGESVVFPAGTEFTLEVTDGSTFVETVTSDGRRCILYTEFGEVQTVNGYPVEEVFEMMFFAG